MIEEALKIVTTTHCMSLLLWGRDLDKSVARCLELSFQSMHSAILKNPLVEYVRHCPPAQKDWVDPSYLSLTLSRSHWSFNQETL